MILNLGDFAASETVYVPFHTFDSNDPSASVTITGLAVTDIEIYKDGSVTQRASDNGYTLLDTDGIDFDGITGLHGISIDLSDNSDAGFYAAGSTYWVAISSITVDGATINFWAAVFTIEKTGGVANILTDTEAILTDSEAILTDSEAILADSEAIRTDTETTLLTDTEAILADTEAAVPVLTDTEAILADTEAATVAAIADQVWDELQSAHVTAGSFGEIATEIASTLTDTEAILTDSEAILADTEAAVPVLTDTEAILADTEGLPSAATIADSVWDEAQADHVAAGSFGETATEIASILTDSEATISDTEAVLADTEAAAPVLTDTEAILADTEASQTSETSLLADTEAILTDSEAILADSEAVLTDTELWDTARAEPTGVPAANAAPLTKLDYVFMGFRNKVTVTSSKKQFYDDDGSVEFEKDLSDDGTTYSESEMNAP